ncbi:TPA: DUF4065 domain-containing protein [Campylobacter coli]|uniref:Panacea domain-containing protein n=1 Tax=Campylobacter coli TaxID=195 RepID=UPI000930591A|nr:type II toxin-antitoxin system antitoxin SocA domain-containing protein [Campylobacter coli]HEB7550037.1 DUF4065 domain-containing protein [Campylobacter coli]HEB9342348.1 DUF4065 domain-containing protein [Campylobacter coli]
MKAENVAKHIINYCLSIDNPISNLQLQKILYFIDIYHLIRTNKRLIEDENFKAWDYGPVIENIYRKYSFFASNPINIYQDFTEEFDENIRGELYGYIDKLSKIYPSVLVEKSHESDSPWDKTKKYETILPKLLEEYASRYRK